MYYYYYVFCFRKSLIHINTQVAKIFMSVSNISCRYISCTHTLYNNKCYFLDKPLLDFHSPFVHSLCILSGLLISAKTPSCHVFLRRPLSSFIDLIITRCFIQSAPPSSACLDIITLYDYHFYHISSSSNHLNLHLPFLVAKPVSYTHLTLPTNREV